MELNLRNGYILPVQVDAVKCELKGVLWFFKDLEMEGGEILLFEYFGRLKLSVYIIGRTGSELNYPEKVHCLQRCSAKTGCHMHKPSFQLIDLFNTLSLCFKFVSPVVSLCEGGWRFMVFRPAGSGIFDDVVPKLYLLISYCSIWITIKIIGFPFRILQRHSLFVVDLLYQSVLHMFSEMERSFLAYTNPKHVALVVSIQCLRY